MIARDVLSRGCLLLLLLAACSLPVTKSSAPERTPQGRLAQTGVASWYGPGFDGKLTASGKIYDQRDLTAAHQTLPLGTRVMVTNLNSGKSAEVIVNDRGPFAKGRILDLSYAAAETLGMIGPGTIPVRLEVIDGPSKIDKIRDRLDYTLQVGSFIEMDKAVKLKDLLAKNFSLPSEVAIVPFRSDETTYYRVQAGLFSSRGDAEAEARRLMGKGFSVVIMEK
jgi:rare lipoprotein A